MSGGAKPGVEGLGLSVVGGVRTCMCPSAETHPAVGTTSSRVLSDAPGSF